PYVTAWRSQPTTEPRRGNRVNEKEQRPGLVGHPAAWSPPGFAPPTGYAESKGTTREHSPRLLPGIVRTYAPQGRTPVLRNKQTRGHGRDDASGEGLHAGAAKIAERPGQHRLPGAPAARGRRAY